MLPPPESELHRLMTQFPRAGQVRWIGLRPARDVPMREVDSAEAVAGKGLRGDRYGSGSGKRGITLIQAEHLPVIAALTREHLHQHPADQHQGTAHQHRSGLSWLLSGSSSSCSGCQSALSPGLSSNRTTLYYSSAQWSMRDQYSHDMTKEAR